MQTKFSDASRLKGRAIGCRSLSRRKEGRKERNQIRRGTWRSARGEGGGGRRGGGNHRGAEQTVAGTWEEFNRGACNEYGTLSMQNLRGN